jgi:hypothetical protein
VANAARLNFNPYLTGAGLGDFAFDDFKRPAGMGNLDNAHFRHKNLGLNPQSEDVKNLARFCTEAIENFKPKSSPASTSGAGKFTFNKQLLFRFKPVLHLMTRPRTLIHITEVSAPGYFIRRRREINFIVAEICRRYGRQGIGLLFLLFLGQFIFFIIFLMAIELMNHDPNACRGICVLKYLPRGAKKF